MSLAGRFHDQYIHSRRTRVLCNHLAKLLPLDAKVLDVGCGDGLLGCLIMQQRFDVEIEGIDVLVRDKTRIPVSRFDGRKIPFPDKSFDAVMFVDVLHHTNDPEILLSEAARVANAILIKDHFKNGLFAVATLRIMDSFGNARHGVALPYNYWTPKQWFEAFASLRLDVEFMERHLGLYPLVANWLFGRSLHFLTLIGPRES